MAAVPGAGLLALLRKRSDGGADGAGVGLASVATGGAPGASPAAAAPHSASKFEARSAAVHALEHAVTAGRVVGEARQAAQGRRIPAGHSFTYDVDVHVPHEAQPQLPVTPVTLINTDYALQHYRQSAVSADFLCYGLRQGHIRVLSRTSAVRALLKGHAKPVTDLQFAGSDMLASGGQDGQLLVWQMRLDEGAGAIHEAQKLRASFVTAAGSAGGDVFLSWHGPSQQLLAVGVGGRVLLVGVPADGMEQLEFELGADSTPDATVLPDWTGEAVTCLSFSPDGQLLAVGGGEGTVRVWELRPAAAAQNGCPALVAQHSVAVPAATAGGAVGTVRWLPTPAEKGWVLLTGNRNCSTLQLWHAPAGGVGGAWAPLQTLRLDGKDGQQEFFVHVDLVPSQQLAILADTPRKAVYTLHWTGCGAEARFDYAARFGVAVPILSFTAAWNPAGGEQHDAPSVELTCVQTTAIQQYSLDPALCYDGGDEAEAAADDGIVRRSSLLERDGHDLQIRSQPSSAVPMPSAELASGTPPKQGTSPPPPAAATPPAAAPAAAVAAAEAAVLDAAVPQAEPSIEGAVSLAGIPPPPAPQPPSPKGESGEVTPEECPSPPPTPTEQQRLAQQAAAAAEAAATAAAAAAAAAEASVQSPPRLLTPSDLLLSASSSSATTGRSSPAAPASEGGRRSTPSAPAEQPPAVPSRLLEPQLVAEQPRVVAAPLPKAAATAAPQAAAPAAEEEAGELPSPSQLPSPLAVAAAPSAPRAQDAAVAAAVAEQMGGVHKKFVGHVSLMYRELLKAMKGEMAAQAAAQQQATAQLLAAAMESQKQQVEAERAAVLAEERASIERLLTAISATLNRDLPAKLQEAVRGELAGMADGLAAGVATSLAPAVQAAVQAALPKELSGAVKAGLDKQLAPAVAAGLGKPLQEAFRSAFTKQVVPAFEGATQAMFQQMNSALAAGLEEHLQASRAALSEPAGLASQLSASLASAQQLSASLSQGHQQLLRAQSIAGTGAHSPAAPADVRAELASLLRSGKYEQSFSRALSLQDVATVGWLASQADAAAVLSREPCPLSQMVLLSLVQQLSADLTTNLAAKLAWIREAAMLINPHDPLLARHVRPVLEGVHAALTAAAARLTGADASSCRLAQHVVHSQLTS